MKRDFSADDVNELWLTDITEHWTDEGKLYLCAIKDVFSGRAPGRGRRGGFWVPVPPVALSA